MHDEFPVKPDIGGARVGRRDMLKSAGVLLAASTTGLGAASGASQGGATPRSRTRRRECSSRGPPQGRGAPQRYGCLYVGS